MDNNQARDTAFEKWWNEWAGYDDTRGVLIGACHDAWQAATEVERERCAKIADREAEKHRVLEKKIDNAILRDGERAIHLTLEERAVASAHVADRRMVTEQIAAAIRAGKET